MFSAGAYRAPAFLFERFLKFLDKYYSNILTGMYRCGIFVYVKGMSHTHETATMKDVKYVINCTEIPIMGESTRTYGIECLVDGNSYKKIDDISLDADAVATLVSKCNRLSLDPLHIIDIAEDFAE